MANPLLKTACKQQHSHTANFFQSFQNYYVDILNVIIDKVCLGIPKYGIVGYTLILRTICIGFTYAFCSKWMHWTVVRILLNLDITW